MNHNLENKTLLTYSDVAAVPLGESGERMVEVATYQPDIIVSYEKDDMRPYLGEKIYVRDTVAKMLSSVQVSLHKSEVVLKIVYGYRHPDIQKKYFDACKEKIRKQSNIQEIDLDSYVHNFVAVPSVAGHPTGGALDLTIVRKDGSPLDMGTRIADYSDPLRIRTFATGLSDEQIQNRRLLHDAMVKMGFAPFYGEWWHFSYGDREWAAFYGKERSLYAPCDFRLEK